MVEIQGMSFHPESLSVASGDTVVWINRDIFPHTATAQGSSPWDSGELEQGDSAHYVVSQSGKLDYICRLHPTMRGALIVR
jgi:plastocyanin